MGWLEEYLPDADSELVELLEGELNEDSSIDNPEKLGPLFKRTSDFDDAYELVLSTECIGSLAKETYGEAADSFLDNALAIIQNLGDTNIDIDAVKHFSGGIMNLVQADKDVAFALLDGLHGKLDEGLKESEQDYHDEYSTIVPELVSYAKKVCRSDEVDKVGSVKAHVDKVLHGLKYSGISMDLKTISGAVKETDVSETLKAIQKSHGLVVSIDYKRLGSTGYRIKIFTLDRKIMESSPVLEAKRDYSAREKPEGNSFYTSHDLNQRGKTERQVKPLIDVLNLAAEAAQGNLHKLRTGLQSRRYAPGSRLRVEDVIPYQDFLSTTSNSIRGLGHFKQ
ncbi:hypothetical protein CMO89_02140 [Candidatus Woesearchaeota archaeon]|nr:hypothetical protein [Candidatus Woesearchaeota archaeon]|tara:strand:- start:20758 stop:21771 length:1014 start_codon:yes stop_codon:yes gene_type:complete